MDNSATDIVKFRKILKITVLVLGSVFLLLFGSAIAAQLPAVQTALARKVMGMVNGKIRGEISLGAVHVSPFEGVSVSGVAVLDPAAWTPDGMAPEDTVLKAGHVTALFSPKALLSGKGIRIREIRISDGFFALTSEPSGEDGEKGISNISRVFSPIEPKPKEKKGLVFPDLQIGSLEIENFAFRMKNYRSLADPLRSDREGTIAWDDLDVSNISLDGRRLRMKGKEISGTLRRLAFTEKSGLEMANISGSAEIGEGFTEVENMEIRDRYSDIRLGKIRLSYEDGLASFNRFLEEVKLDGEMDGCLVDSRTIGYFAGAVGKMDFTAAVDGAFSGYVCDFRVRDLFFRESPGGVSATVNGRLTGLPSSQGMILDAKISGADFTLDEMAGLIRGFAPAATLDLSGLAPGQRFLLDATAKGPLNRLAVQADGKSDIGSFKADMELRNTIDSQRPIMISGNLATESLDLGAVTGSRELGPCSLMANLAATLEKGGPSLTLDTLVIDRLTARGYTYRGISGAGRYKNGSFEGRVVSNDPCLNFRAEARRAKATAAEDGLLQFSLSLARADLEKTNFNLHKEGRASVSMDAEGFVNEHRDGGLGGELQIGNIILQDDHGIHKAGDLLAVARMEPGSNSISLNSAFLEGLFYGTGTPADFARDLAAASLKRELPAIFGPAGGDTLRNTYDLRLKLFDSIDVLSFVVPGLYAADSTTLNLSMDHDGTVDAEILSGRLAYKNKYLKDVRITMDNRDSLLSATVEAGSLSVSPILTKDNLFRITAHDDTAGLRFTFDNDSELANSGDIMLDCGFARNGGDSLEVTAGIRPSELCLDSVPWKLSPASVKLAGGRVKVDGFELRSGEHSLNIDGGYSPALKDSLILKLNNFDISAANPHLGGKLTLGGLASGSAVLNSPVRGGLGMLMDMKVDSTVISGHGAGTFLLGSKWNKELKGFDISLKNVMDGKSNIAAKAFFSPTGKRLDGAVGLSDFELGYAKGLFKGLFSEFSGKLRGRVGISGSLDAPDIESEDLRIDDASVRVDFTGVPYSVSGPLRIDNGGIHFDSLAVRDSDGESGSVNGGLLWNRFRDMTLATDIDFSRMRVLDTPETPGSAFYGKVFASGKLSVTGPLNSLMLDATAVTEKRGEFHIPMTSASAGKVSDLLVFTEPESKKKIDTYEILMGRYTAPKKSSSLGIRLKVEANPATEAFVELDKASGNVLTGRGNGDIEVEVNPQNGGFTLKGGYTLTEGNYHLDVMGIAKKDFRISDGSSVRFSGDIMDSDLDIKAVYSTKTFVGTLINDNSSTARRTVECEIDISDKLRAPRIELGVNVPNLDPETQISVQNALNTDDKVQKQFISLLVSGSFLPSDNSGIVNNSNTLNTTVAEIMASQLNSILQKLDIPVDLGLDFQSTTSGQSVYDVAISTQLFNNRVIVNGTLGNSMYSATTTGEEDLVGDLDIEVKMDQSGSLRVTLFSHSADQYSNFLDNSQRNGIGLAYQKEFDSVKEFFRDLFSSRRQRKEREAERLKTLMDTDRKVIEIKE